MRWNQHILTSKERNEVRILRKDITHIYRKDDSYKIYDNLKSYVEN